MSTQRTCLWIMHKCSVGSIFILMFVLTAAMHVIEQSHAEQAPSVVNLDPIVDFNVEGRADANSILTQRHSR
jgi:hypothetical protein